MTMSDRPMLVVFDTSTQPEYYRDVHRIMALPSGAIIRYDYKRYLFSNEAGHLLTDATVRTVPIDVILMYGELKTYNRGDPDRSLPMLTWDNAKFAPTRSAKIVNIAIEEGAERAQDTIHFHLQLSGFVDPASPVIEQLIRRLEAQNQLPFGDQHCWISCEPDDSNIARRELMSDDPAPWFKVVDWMFSADTQFKGDIFWRVRRVISVRGNENRELFLSARSSNRFGDTNDWHRDYEVHDLAKYKIEYQTYAPSAHGGSVHGNATLAVILNDDDALIRTAPNPTQIRASQTYVADISVEPINRLERRYSDIDLVTQIPDWESPYPPGSLCRFTVSIVKDKLRLMLAAAYAFLALVATATATAKVRTETEVGIASYVLAAILAAIAYYSWTGKIKR